ncbi:MAG: helix-turn-helix domain-containing protein [Oscillospiraceae bacterium]|nr:helix-turn-helix domain-containing protein [Oscillospiraceae bacterium]
MKRNYTHIKAFDSEIIEMREAGKTRQEIANELGLEKEQIKGWVKRYNRRIAEAEITLPTQTKPQARPKNSSAPTRKRIVKSSD